MEGVGLALASMDKGMDDGDGRSSVVQLGLEHSLGLVSVTRAWLGWQTNSIGISYLLLLVLQLPQQYCTILQTRTRTIALWVFTSLSIISNEPATFSSWRFFNTTIPYCTAA